MIRDHDSTQRQDYLFLVATSNPTGARLWDRMPGESIEDILAVMGASPELRRNNSEGPQHMIDLPEDRDFQNDEAIA